MKAAATSTSTAAPPAVRETGPAFPRPSEPRRQHSPRSRGGTDPLALRAVTSTEVFPDATGVSVTTLPFTVAVTTPELRDRASTRTPAGVKACAKSTSTVAPPTDRETGANVPTARGAATATFTEIVRVVGPPAFRAVTSTDALPAATGVRVTDGPSPTTPSRHPRSGTVRSPRSLAGEKAFRRSTTSAAHRS